jgi:flagellar assembly protein FliH
MDVVISTNATQGHIINRYQFKALSAAGSSSNQSDMNNMSDDEFVPLTQSYHDNNTIDPAAVINPSDKMEKLKQAETLSQPDISNENHENIAVQSDNEMTKNLMKQLEEVTSNYIKAQMKLEDIQEEMQQKLDIAKKEGFDEGVQTGRAQIENDLDKATQSGINQFSTTISTLETSAQTFESALINIQNDLIHAALDIAKEVINIEVNDNGSQIALALSQGLIDDLKSASKVTLKVNPTNHGFLSEKLGLLEHVTIMSDNAVSPGGVIIISDAGNVDAEIHKRYEKVKEAALTPTSEEN